VEVGADVFFDDYPHIFFGRLRNNTNLYTTLVRQLMLTLAAALSALRNTKSNGAYTEV
jgi:hypothetical protein